MNPAQRPAAMLCSLTSAVVCAATFGGLAVNDAAAQKWPEKTVRIVTPFAPGGGTDIFARILAQRLSEATGQQFIVENRPGAGSTLGTEYVAKSPADGYTFLMTSASFSFNPGLYPKLRYDSIKDFARVSQVVQVPHVIVVMPSLPVKDLQDFVKLARARPGEVLYASAGAGSAMHLAGALFGIVTKTQLTHVPYKGGGATTAAVMGGEATTAFNTLETVMALIRARPAAGARGVDARARAGAAATCRPPSEAGIQGLRSDRLVRPDGAGGHAARDRRAAERRSGEGDGDAGDPRAHAGAGRDAGRQHAGRSSSASCATRSPSGRASSSRPASSSIEARVMGQQIEKLAQFVARDAVGGYSRAGAAAREAGAARHAGRDPRGVGAARGAATARAPGWPTAGTGATVLARGWPAHDPRTAALLNGIAGRAIELCEGLRLVSGQAGDAGSARRAGGRRAAPRHRPRDAGRLRPRLRRRRRGSCSAFTPRPLAHQNGQASLLAAAAAGARVRGLDAAGVSRAMRIATTLLLTPSYTNAVAGATTLNVAGGMSGFVGALAPELALPGSRRRTTRSRRRWASWWARASSPTACSTSSARAGRSRATTSASTPAAIRSTRRSTACRRALAALRPRPEEIERIDVATYRFASVMRIPIRPTTSRRSTRCRTPRR